MGITRPFQNDEIEEEIEKSKRLEQMIPKTNPFETPASQDVSIITPELEKNQIIGLSAKAIEQAFAPMVEKLQLIEDEFYAITKKPINDETIVEAKELRLRMVKIRTGTAAVHKEQKAESLRKGRAIDGIKNILEAAIVDKEEVLSKIENHFINIEREAKLKLYNDRREMLLPYVNAFNIEGIPLGEMNSEAFDNMLNGYKLAAEEKIRVEELEAARIESERVSKELENKSIREENERLKIQSEIFADRISKLSKLGSLRITMDGGHAWHLVNLSGGGVNASELSIRTYNDEEYNEVLDLFTKVYTKNQIILKEQFNIDEKKRIATESRLKKEREERKRLETEQREREEKEEQERKKRMADERKAKRAPDKVKLLTLAEQIELLPLPDLREDEAKVILTSAQDLLAKVVNYIIKNANNL